MKNILTITLLLFVFQINAQKSLVNKAIREGKNSSNIYDLHVPKGKELDKFYLEQYCKKLNYRIIDCKTTSILKFGRPIKSVSYFSFMTESDYIAMKKSERNYENNKGLALFVGLTFLTGKAYLETQRALNKGNSYHEYSSGYNSNTNNCKIDIEHSIIEKTGQEINLKEGSVKLGISLGKCFDRDEHNVTLSLKNASNEILDVENSNYITSYNFPLTLNISYWFYDGPTFNAEKHWTKSTIIISEPGNYKITVNPSIY